MAQQQASSAVQGDEEWAQGWSANIEYFLNNGYSSAEMYAITYGNRNLTYAMNRSIDCATVIKMRLFLEAVLQYTGFQHVDIVAHSMGVTIARIIIQGKTFSEAGKGCHASSVVTEALHIQTNASNR
uniref:Lipase domain-containing protein n=1 Tax=Globodera pallida TaxID=36090 RepID=A0A183BMU0_GLOPA